MKKILIVDDDADIRLAISTLLEGKYELKEASSRSEAMETLKTFVPDLVVLDVMMEENDSGFNLAREIKDDDRLKNIKILMTTNIDNEMNMDFKKEAGDPDWLPVDDYIVKPVEAKSFLPKIEKLI